MITDAWERLKGFMTTDAADFLAREAELTRDLDLYYDLDMNPKDIEHVIGMWAARFSIDISQFNLDFYYPSEKLGIGAFLATVVKSPFSMKARETLGGHTLTLGMMEDAMRVGRWIE